MESSSGGFRIFLVSEAAVTRAAYKLHDYGNSMVQRGHSKGGISHSKGGNVFSVCGMITLESSNFLEGGIMLSEDGMTPSEGGIIPSEGGMMHSEGSIIPSEGGTMTPEGGIIFHRAELCLRGTA